MNDTASNSLLNDRFAWLIEALCKAIGAHVQTHRMQAPLAWAAWNRVRLLGDQFLALSAPARSGMLPARRTAAAVRPASPLGPARAGRVRRPGPGPRAPRSAQAQCRAAASLPREFGWIRPLLPPSARHAALLSFLLLDPQMAQLVRKAPQARRILRQLAHLLGVQPLPWYLLVDAGAGPGCFRESGRALMARFLPEAMRSGAGQSVIVEGGIAVDVNHAIKQRVRVRSALPSEPNML